MELTKRTAAVIGAVVLAAASWSCSSKKSSASESSASQAETAASSEADTTTDTEKQAVTTEAGTEPTTEAPSATEGSGTTTASETTAPTTTTETANKPTRASVKGYDNSYEAAKAYYNAYLKGDADAVYDMLCTEEIEAYHAYLRSTDLLDGKNPQVVFKRSNVINAIKQSIQAIHDIMKEKSDVPPEKWTVSLTEELLRQTGENELKDFNKVLNTDFTAASDCGFVYYKDGNDDHSFIGNGCAFVELDGRWYLSYSTIMNAELITYLDIF